LYQNSSFFKNLLYFQKLCAMIASVFAEYLQKLSYHKKKRLKGAAGPPRILKGKPL